ncbi:alpha/beta hydrolase [Tropicimonas sp. IMCC6043]|uniref:alpha/beta hydrolase n=1 Tax=Tropicimonas sp. IMCC6043 TaxID=2510645 RepID=UPI00101C7750|nr:alpha/beta hydrolase [Tropicimonas sp. IMCC6043]RYH11796.1 alpha/beta hydrolase [Tropicimonas sp. IMCC6043]
MIDPTAYDNADFIPGGHGYFDRWPAAARAFRERWPADRQRLDRPYGAEPRQRFDLFLPETETRGLVIFVHGGFWRMGGREDWSHLAAGPLAHGWAVAIPSYPLAPAARVSEITRSIAQALPVIADGIAGPLLIAGHSAGGQLALRMVCPDAGLPDALADRIAGIQAISPLADLNPLLMLPINADLRIDAAEAERESPINCPAPRCAVEIEVGAAERPAFVDQAIRMADAWPKAELTVTAGSHHFDVIEPLADPQSAMVGRLLSMAEG